MRDTIMSLREGVQLANASYATDQTGSVIEAKALQGLGFLVHVGVGGITFDTTNKIEFVLEEGDASNLSDAAAVPADSMIVDPDTANGETAPATSGIFKALIAAHAAAKVYRVGYRGSKKYVRVKVDFSGTHGTATPIGITYHAINDRFQGRQPSGFGSGL